MKVVQLTIATLSKGTFDIFKSMFEDTPEVTIMHGSLFTTRADAIVSPANSFGIMDGGIDKEIIDTIGSGAQYDLQNLINNEMYGELHVGQAVTVKTSSAQFPFMISAPTMRVPADVASTDHAYSAMRAMLIQADKHNFDSVAMPTFCTGTGRMSNIVAATQMKMAWLSIYKEYKTEDFETLGDKHIKLYFPHFIPEE